MPVNLTNEKDLNAYLTDLVYQGEEEPSVYKDGNFKSIDYVRQNKDGIVKGMLNQYVKHRLRSFLTDKEEPFLEEVETSEELPVWAQRALEEGKKVHRFDAQKMTSGLRENITTIRDFLYSAAESYVDKALAIAEDTKQNPKLRMDYLKTSNEYDTFEKTLLAAKTWHEIMAKRAEQLAKDKELFEKSLTGTKFVMDLPDGMAAYKLTTSEALDFESEYMGHCVGKGAYDEGVKNGKIEIYSVRDKNGEPHATFEVREDEVYQCKGKGNKAPVERYRPAIQEFVKQKGFDIQGDTANVGLIHQDGKYYDMYHLPKGFVIKGDLDFSEQDITQLPDLSGVIVEGDFLCYKTKITSLEGAPQEVGGWFDCSDTQITSLQGGPQKVGGDFYCSYTQITSLQGAPRQVGGDFECAGTQITSLQGGPQKVGGYFNCSDTQIISLQGAPQKVGGSFNCRNTQITSLQGAPQQVGGSFNCRNTQITSLQGAPQQVGGYFNCSDTQITSLQGAPQQVAGDFSCSNTQITSLQGAPQKVGGSFYCSYTQITSLQGAPQEVAGDFYCFYTQITSLQGAPQQVGGNFNCSDTQITSLQGGPQQVGGRFDCAYTQITSLQGAPQKVGRKFNCAFTPIKDIDAELKKWKSGAYNEPSVGKKLSPNALQALRNKRNSK